MLDSVTPPQFPADPAADRALRGVVGLTEALLPGRAVAVYLHGSHRDGTALQTSDLDVVVVLRPGVPDRERNGLAHALGVLSEAAAVPTDVLVASEDELRRAGAVWLRDHATLVRGQDVAVTFTPLSPAEYARLAMHGAMTNLTRLYPPDAQFRTPLPPPNPADAWLGYARRPVRLPDGRDRPGTALLVSNVFWAANALAQARGSGCLWDKRTVARAYREHVADEWADFLEELFQRCRGEWGYLIPDGEGERSAFRGLCERAAGFFDHFLAVYRTFLLSEAAEGMPAQRFALQRLKLLGIAE